jgi:DNA-binding IclR family transcriptional regulator
LEQAGFLASSGEPQRFQLGSSVAQLAHVWLSEHRIAELAQPVLRNLWEATSETVALFVPDDTHRLCVAELESHQPLVNGAASVTNPGDAGASRGRLTNKRGGSTMPIITASNA